MLCKAGRSLRFGLGGRATQLIRLDSPRNLWIGIGLTLLLAVVARIFVIPLLDHSDKELRADLQNLLVNPPAVDSRVAFISAASNPLPNAGFPHGRGMTHGDFPDGYMLHSRPRVTFNSYIDGRPIEFSDERHFLRACFINTSTGACLDRTSEPGDYVPVAPGDRLTVSILVNNNGDPSGNSDGDGPAVGRNSRVLVSFPTRERARTLNLSAYIYADNALVDEARPRLKTISDNLAFRSMTGRSIQLKYEPDEARILQVTGPGRTDIPGVFSYRSWILTGNQQYMLFTGTRSSVEGNTEQDPSLGLPVGSSGSTEARMVVGVRQSDKLNFFAGVHYHLFVQFKVRVAGSW